MQEVLKTEIVSIDLMDFVLRPCLDPKILHQKTSHRMFGHMHGVLNETYL